MNETLQIMPATIQAVTTPLQLVAMVICMIFIVVILLVVSNVMDKKNKAVIDKETAVRMVEREAQLRDIRDRQDRTDKRFVEHVTVEHTKYGQEYKELREAVYSVREILAVIAHQVGVKKE